MASGKSVVFADAQHGNDSNPGTEARPFATVEAAVAACRSKAPGCTVRLRGTFHLQKTLELSPKDSLLTIEAMEEEEAVLSGGVPLSGLQWRAAKGMPAGVVAAELPDAVAGFEQLFVDGERAVRARHPNANPGGYYTTGLYSKPTGYFNSAKEWIRNYPRSASRTIHQKAVRNTTRYSDFVLGYDGPVSEFDPPAAYWAVDKPPAGGGCKYEVPRGLVYDDATFRGTVPPSKWARGSAVGAVVHAFHHAHWGGWQFEVKELVKENSSLLFSRGGFQEARGSCGKGGHEWFVENVKELLDVGGEWWLDAQAKPSVLYYMPNSTAATIDEALASASASTFIASRLKTLVAVNGTDSRPVRNLTVRGLTLAHAAPTFMDRYEVPSAGDWSIHRGGALFISRAEDIEISGSLFEQVGGNAICVSEHTRGVRIIDNEMSRIGDSGVLVVGALHYYSERPWEHLEEDYPVGTVVQGNLMHELGVFGKQTAGFFQALAANTTVDGNVILNGPRSGVNFNDAAFGGNRISRNLFGNLVRETVDHGPYNSWDRNPYITKASGGVPSPIPLMSSVTRNFLFCNYKAIKGIDHDDASGYYDDTENFMPWCSGKLKGETQALRGNVLLFPSFGTQCVHMMGGMKAGIPMVFANNTCVARSADIYTGTPACTSDRSLASFGQNRFWVPGGDVGADGIIPGFSCEKGNWTRWVQSGQDGGSVISGKQPSTQMMVSWGYEVLQFAPRQTEMFV